LKAKRVFYPKADAGPTDDASLSSTGRDAVSPVRVKDADDLSCKNEGRNPILSKKIVSILPE